MNEVVSSSATTMWKHVYPAAAVVEAVVAVAEVLPIPEVAELC